MSELDDIYQEIVLEHSRKPRNFRKIDEADQVQEGYNPLCGDQYTIYISMDGDTVSDISFQGTGCAISKASASMMTEEVIGKTKNQATRIFEAFRSMITKDNENVKEDLGDIEVLQGVSEYPTRIKCATLSWHAMHAAVEDQEGDISTEKV
tara:strand:- start:63 stop:515 length:453 start_codon:yes stop_codon:yes gene_type:complete